MFRSIALIALSVFLPMSLAFVPSNHLTTKFNRDTQLNVLPAIVPSLLAGSIAGAVGVGVAYPLDTIKTKAQVLATEDRTPSQDLVLIGSTGALALPPPKHQGNSMAQVAINILKTEGIAGFFGGVQTSMAGQAIIKAVVFAVNTYMLEFYRGHNMFDGNTNLQLLFAAATAGFVTSFLAAPVDRIKVLMQTGGSTYEGREDQAFQAVIQTEGWKGLMGRGLLCTMMREIPAYSLYFGVYGLLQNWTPVTEQLGPWAPMIYGAVAGCACWIPIYPIDVIKTFVQNTEGDKDDHDTSPLKVAAYLYQTHGVGVFWDGIAPRLMRQAVNHATTFALYEALVNDVFSKM